MENELKKEVVEYENIREFRPVVVEKIKTIKQLKENLLALGVSQKIYRELPHMLSQFVNVFKNNVNIKCNILIISDNDEQEIVELVAGFLHGKNLCSNSLLTNYDFEKPLTQNTYVSCLKMKSKRYIEDIFVKIKKTNKNLINITVVDQDFFEEYIEYFYFLFPFILKNIFSKQEKMVSLKTKIERMGFSMLNKNFIKQGIEISGGPDTFDLELNAYLVSKSLQSKNREAKIEEFEAHVKFKNWKKVDKLKKNNDKIKKEKNKLKLEYDDIVGLNNAKREIKRIVQYVAKNKEEKASFHMAFLGNPGTGKTIMARLLAQELFKAKVIQDNKIVEVSRVDLIGEYVGHTAAKTKSMVERALGGILFIDEAYSLTTSKSDKDFGPEAISTLVKEMEDNRENLIVIFAGYTDEMKNMLKTNKGLESRIAFKINFENYSGKELMQIFERFLSRSKYTITKSAITILQEHFEKQAQTQSKYFGNGRFVRNFFEKLKLVQAQDKGFEITEKHVLQVIQENSLMEEKEVKLGFVN